MDVQRKKIVQTSALYKTEDDSWQRWFSRTGGSMDPSLGLTASIPLVWFIMAHHFLGWSCFGYGVDVQDHPHTCLCTCDSLLDTKRKTKTRVKQKELTWLEDQGANFILFYFIMIFRPKITRGGPKDSLHWNNIRPPAIYLWQIRRIHNKQMYSLT